MTQRQDEAYRMRVAGISLAQIGAFLGVSTGRASQLARAGAVNAEIRLTRREVVAVTAVTLDTALEDLNVSIRVLHAYQNYGLEDPTVRDVMSVGRAILRLRKIGTTSCGRLVVELKRHGFDLDAVDRCPTCRQFVNREVSP